MKWRYLIQHRRSVLNDRFNYESAFYRDLPDQLIQFNEETLRCSVS